MYSRIINKQTKISVIGLGYVGLPLALGLAKKASVVGFDINAARVAMMKDHVAPSNEIPSSGFQDRDIEFTIFPEDLKKACFHIVAVPTPINKHNLPDQIGRAHV